MSYQEQTTVDQTVAPLRDERLATKDVFDTMAADPELSRFTELVRSAGLEARLHGPDLLTVLAVRNHGFDGVEQTAELARDHVLRAAATSDELKASGSVKTLNDRLLTVRKENGDLFIDGARLIRSDIECTNGVVQIVDGLLGR